MATTLGHRRVGEQVRRGLLELSVVAALYVIYGASRLLASTDLSAARDRAHDLVEIEADLFLDVESVLNRVFVEHDWLGVAGSFWYATTHYVVTVGLLVWLYLRSDAASYLTARRTLAVSTVIGLVFYLTMPTAPPRLVEGYTDVLALHSTEGWWGSDASAPQGLGHLTNELAAFPSLHAGWALWVLLVAVTLGAPHWVRFAAAAYTGVMAVVIVGTGNHWVLDVVAGWAAVLVAWGLVTAWQMRGRFSTESDIDQELRRLH